MKQQTKILFDFGGTIARDEKLFHQIAKYSGNEDAEFLGSDSWENIKCIGSVNYFDKIIDNYFDMLEFYPQAIEVVSSFYGNHGFDSPTQSYIVFDNRPELGLKSNICSANISRVFYKHGGQANGFYTDRDKLNLTKVAGMSLLIEDDPRMAITLASVGLKVIMPLRKWNRLFNPDSMRICMSEKKYKAIENNIIFAEDFIDIREIIKDHLL